MANGEARYTAAAAAAAAVAAPAVERNYEQGNTRTRLTLFVYPFTDVVEHNDNKIYPNDHYTYLRDSGILVFEKNIL